MAIAKNGSLKAAANQLHVTQPALTHSLHRLEADLEVQLFERTNRGLRLTLTGETLLPKAESLLDQWSELAVIAKDHTEKIRGKIRLGLHPSVAIYALPAFLAEFQTKYPEIRLELKHDSSRNLSRGVIESDMDVGLIINPIQHPDLMIKEVTKDEVTLWVAKNCAQPKTLIFDPQMTQCQWILRSLAKLKLNFPRTIESSNLEVIAMLVREGCGVGILPHRVIGMEASVKKFHPSAPVFHDKLCLVYKPGFRKLARGKALIESISNSSLGQT